MKHVAASAAPTRFWITRTTSTIRVLSPTRARTWSPGTTVVEGFAGLSLMRTWPPRHAWAASGRVLVSRTAHSQRSMRVDSTPPSWHPLQIVKILAVALTLAASSLTSVGPLGELTDLAVERVQVADLVAAAKFGTTQPIDDPAREQQVLDTVRTKATALGLNPENAARFFRAQIEANKLVQRGLYARWTEHPEEVPQRRPDLGTEVRPILDRLTTEILAELKDTERLRKPTLKCEIHATIAERSAVVLHHLDRLHENALAEAMRTVCSE